MDKTETHDYEVTLYLVSGDSLVFNFYNQPYDKSIFIRRFCGPGFVILDNCDSAVNLNLVTHIVVKEFCHD